MEYFLPEKNKKTTGNPVLKSEMCGINGKINQSNNKMKTVIGLWRHQGLVLELKPAHACHYCSGCRVSP